MKWGGNNKCKTIQCQWNNQKNKLKIAILMKLWLRKRSWRFDEPSLYEQLQTSFTRTEWVFRDWPLKINLRWTWTLCETVQKWVTADSFVFIIIYQGSNLPVMKKCRVLYCRSRAVCSLSSTGASSYSSLHKILRKRDGNILLSFIILLIQSRDRPICWFFQGRYWSSRPITEI